MQMVYAVTISAALVLAIVMFNPLGQTGMSVQVDQRAPALPAIPFHQSFVNEETCLQCHRESRQINLQGEILETPKMAHEFRDACVSCHQLPNMM